MSERYFVVEAHNIEDYWSKQTSIAPYATQLSKGIFYGKIEVLSHPEITLSRRITSQWISEHGFLPSGDSAFSLHTTQFPLYAGGAPYLAGDIAALAGGNPYQFIAAANARICGLRFNMAALERYTDSATRRLLEQHLHSGLTTKLVADGSLDHLIVLLETTLNDLNDANILNEEPHADFVDPQQKAYLADIRAQLFATIGALIKSSTIVTERLNSRSRLFQKTLEIILNTPLTAINLTQLVDTLGTSRRNLELVFSERFDITPKELINNLRLNKARRMLLRQDDRHLTIAQIAQECGINHLGNFARNYSAMFNELPRDTLERVQANTSFNPDRP